MAKPIPAEGLRENLTLSLLPTVKIWLKAKGNPSRLIESLLLAIKNKDEELTRLKQEIKKLESQELTCEGMDVLRAKQDLLNKLIREINSSSLNCKEILR